MGGKKREVPMEIRKLIIEHHKIGKTLGEIAKIVKLSKSTVFDIVSLYKKTNSIEKRRRSGRPKIFTEADERWILYQIRKNPKKSAVKLTNEIELYLKKTVSAETVRNVLRKYNLHGRVPRKKPYINKRNRLKRLRFAAAYINKPTSYWRTVIFADESKYNLFGSDGLNRVWREPNTAFEEQHIVPTIKHGGGNQMVWGCMAASGVGNLCFIDGKMDKYGYLNVLKENLKDSARNLGLENTFQFYQDNDPKHKADVCRLWLLYNCPKVIPAPPQSPDLNPIEHLWEYLERKLRIHNISNKTELRETVQQEWNNIDPGYCEKLANSMPNRLREVLRRRGRATKY